MAAANIIIDQPTHSTQPSGIAGRSRDDIESGKPVTLRNENDTGVRSWRWEIVDQPDLGSPDQLSSPLSSTTTFTPTRTGGTYLVQLTVNEGREGEVQRLLVVIRDGRGVRYPAAQEDDEANWIDTSTGAPNERGWWPDLKLALDTARNQDLDWKRSARAATAGALPSNTLSNGVLTAAANGALPAQDGVTLAVGEDLLVKNEGGGTSVKNGVYTVTDLGSGSTPWILTRRDDADTDAEVTAMLACPVSEGTTQADTAWILTTNDPITLDTTALTFSQFGGAGPVETLAQTLTAGNVMEHGQSIIGEADGDGSDGGDLAFTTGTTTSAGGDGGDWHVDASPGLAGTGAGIGGAGGDIVENLGDGGAGGSTGQGGPGGTSFRTAGDGGAGGSTSGNGGLGGWCRTSSGDGGAATTSGSGGAAGRSDFVGGVGGAGAGSGAGGTGGGHAATAGAGGAGGATGDGGSGGVATSKAGAGGAGGATSGDGGAGGAGTYSAGAGGDAATEGLGGAGGGWTGQAGDGGDAATATAQNQNGGTPGTAKIVAGDAGAGTGTHSRVGGNVELVTGAGTSSSAAADGDVLVRSGGPSGTVRWRFVAGQDLVPETHAVGTVGSGAKYAEEVYSKKYFGDTTITLKPGQAEPPATAYATVDERNGYPCLDFDDGSGTVDEATRFSTMMPASYRGYPIDVTIVWAATSATTGNVKWDVEFDKVTPGVHDIDNTSYASPQSSGAVACPGTSGVLVSTTISFTQAQADTVGSGDLFRIRLRRDTSDAADTMTGDAEVYAVIVKEV